MSSLFSNIKNASLKVALNEFSDEIVDFLIKKIGHNIDIDYNIKDIHKEGDGSTIFKLDVKAKLTKEELEKILEIK